MKLPIAARAVLADIRLSAPAARTILITSPRGDPGCRQVADALAEALREAGQSVECPPVPLAASRGRPGEAPAGSNGPAAAGSLSPADIADVGRARLALQSPGGFTVVCIAGLLDQPAALVLSAAADAVVLVARRGRTFRLHTAEARREIQRVGGTVVAAVLLD